MIQPDNDFYDKLFSMTYNKVVSLQCIIQGKYFFNFSNWPSSSKTLKKKSCLSCTILIYVNFYGQIRVVNDEKKIDASRTTPLLLLCFPTNFIKENLTKTYIFLPDDGVSESGLFEAHCEIYIYLQTQVRLNRFDQFRSHCFFLIDKRMLVR